MRTPIYQEYAHEETGAAKLRSKTIEEGEDIPVGWTRTKPRADGGPAASSAAPSSTSSGAMSSEDLIRAAIGKLNPDDKAHWTSKGLPDAKVLSEHVGFNVSAKQRNEIYAAM